MSGFKNFILKGNLVEFAVAVIIATAFGAVVTAFTKIIIELLAKAGGAPSFDTWRPLGLSSVGPFLTALVSFLILSFVVYFFVVRPFTSAFERFAAEEDPTEDTLLLREIRDSLRTR